MAMPLPGTFSCPKCKGVMWPSPKTFVGWDKPWQCTQCNHECPESELRSFLGRCQQMGAMGFQHGMALLGNSHAYVFKNSTEFHIKVCIEEDPEGLIERHNVGIKADAGAAAGNFKAGLQVNVKGLRNEGGRETVKESLPPGRTISVPCRSSQIFVRAGAYHAKHNLWEVMWEHKAIGWTPDVTVEFLPRHCGVVGNALHRDVDKSFPKVDTLRQKPLSEPQNKCKAGQSVKVFSHDTNSYVDAKVVGIDHDGSAFVEYVVKTKVLPGKCLPQEKGQNLSAFREGQAVQSFSCSRQAWVNATVKSVLPDGSIGVEYDGKVRMFALCDQKQWVKMAVR